MSDFEPPKYIEKLIGAVNDGAKAAQLGALAFVAIGLFLLATSFSATDEDLLLGKSIAISQLGGVAVPVALSFGFMPAVFVAVHLYTLIRFEMLAGNVRHLMSELAAQVKLEADRVRCRQLLANVEFIQAVAVPGASWVYRWTAWGIIAVFPVMVLVLVQLGSLRLQSYVVNVVHHVAIFADLVLLVWFSWRLRGVVAMWRKDTPLGGPRWRLVTLRVGAAIGIGFRRARLALVPLAVIAADVAWFRVPTGTETTIGAGKSWRGWDHLPAGTVLDRLAWWNYLRLLVASSWHQPVDLWLCPEIRIGCRFLSVPGRVLVGKVWDSKSFVELRASQELNEERQAAFEPAVMQERSLLFANLSDSQLFAADLTKARLLGANLRGASLQGANLVSASLQGADLTGASLQYAKLRDAWLQRANLNAARMQGANLDGALLKEADLSNTKLQGANLSGASLQNATMYDAELQNANLELAKLQGAILTNAMLQGANLSHAELLGAILDGASLQDTKLNAAEMSGAYLIHASLQGADLAGAKLQGAKMIRASLRWADLRGARLLGANLSGASLQGAVLNGASLHGVILDNASLQGATLNGASLQGATLNGASLQGADLRSALLWNVVADARTDMRWVDARDTAMTPLAEREARTSINGVPGDTKDQMRNALTPRVDGDRLPPVKPEVGPMLVSDHTAVAWTALRPDQITTDAAVIAPPLAAYLADHVATISAVAATRVALRLDVYGCDRLRDALLTPLRDRLLEHVAVGKVTLPPERIQWLKDQKALCVPTPAAR